MAGKPKDPGDSILRLQAAYTRASKQRKKATEAVKAQSREERRQQWQQEQNNSQAPK